jgi:serine/threonine-protein kinase Chk2
MLYDDPQLIVVRERFCGKSLQEDSPKTLYEATQILVQLCSALDYLHDRERPIAHRDIRPDNVIITYDGHNNLKSVKLVGFAMATERFDPFCGILEWAAPEILLRNAYDQRVDVWGVGRTVSWTICGSPDDEPRYKANPQTWCVEVIQHVAISNTDIESPTLNFLLENMIIIRPEKRTSAKVCLEKAAQLLLLTDNDLVLVSSAKNKDSEGSHVV